MLTFTCVPYTQFPFLFCLLLPTFPWLNSPFFNFNLDITSSERAQLRSHLLWEAFSSTSQDWIRSCSLRTGICLAQFFEMESFVTGIPHHNPHSSKDFVLFAVKSLVMKSTNMSICGMTEWFLFKLSQYS